MTSKRYLTAAETAKLVRKALKSAYPSTKFYVTSSTYSGGASIDINWVDGPTTKQVDKTVAAYRGAGFDGMVDLKFNYDAYLMPDGTATIAKCDGSGCTFDSYENPKPHPDAELVSFGADFIHTSRHHSPEFVRRVAAEIAEQTGWEIPPIIEHRSSLTNSKSIDAAYFEDRRFGHDETIWREFTNALYNTAENEPAKAECVRAAEEYAAWEAKYEASQAEKEQPTAEELAAENKAIHEAELVDIAREQEAIRKAQTKTQETQPMEWVVAPDAEPEPTALQQELYDTLSQVALDIVASTVSRFIQLYVQRKLEAVSPTSPIADLVKVGDDLVLMAETL